MKRIVLLIRSLDIGGAERQLVELAKGLHRLEVPVRVLTFYGAGALRQELEGAGVGVEDLGKRGRWDVVSFLWRLFRWLRRNRPDVLYSWLSTANALAATVGRLAGIPKIVLGVRASNLDLSRYDWLLRLDFSLSRLASHGAHLIVCNSREGLEYHARLGYPRQKMQVIENGIDTGRFRFDASGRERLRAEWGVAEDEFLVGMVARLDPMKDHTTFLHAAALLARQCPTARFCCVGSGPAEYRMQLEALADGLGLGGRLIWAGTRHDLPAVYSAFDLASSSSFGEGFSNAIAEAMSCERTCIVTDVGDSARIVGDCGWVVPPKQPEALARAWLAALALPGEERLRIGRAARQRILAQFSVARMVERTLRALGS